MEKSPRAKALAFVREEAEIDEPSMPTVEPNSREALDFIDSIEEERFASLALAIDVMFDYAQEQKPSRPPDGLLRRSFTLTDDPWENLRLDMSRTLLDALENATVSRNKAAISADKFTRIVGVLDGSREINLVKQLDAGITTGTTTSLVLLRNLPRILSYHGFSDLDTENLIQSAIRSTSLIRPLAKTCINRMMTAQGLLAGREESRNWGSLGVVLDPEQFTVHRLANGSLRVGYRDFSGMEVPAGYTAHELIKPADRAAKLEEIVCHKTKVIGCPITLLSRRLSELWGWHIEAIGARRMWEPT